MGEPQKNIGMTVQEAADALRVDTRIIRRMIHDRVIPARICGKGWRIHPKAIEDWLLSGNDTDKAKEMAGRPDTDLE